MHTNATVSFYGNLILANVSTGWFSVIFLLCAFFILGLSIYKGRNE